MHQAALYHRTSERQCRDVKRILEEHANIIQWRADGTDSLIDIGCGPGNVLIDLVYPLMPKNFEIVLGADISEKMIEYAEKYYEKVERCKFKIFDVCSEFVPNELCNRFDHVTSFFCLHWVQNQRKALENIYKLLRSEGGDCLLVFLVDDSIYHVHKELSTQLKWAEYMQDVDQFISPLRQWDDAGKVYRSLLTETGFMDCAVEIRHEEFIYEGVEIFKDTIRSISAFVGRMPEKLQEDFMNDFVKTMMTLELVEKIENTSDYKIKLKYKLIVAYARKAGEYLNNVTDNCSLRGLN